ncbi:MAG: hypothetical protein ACE5G0_02300 [Rhodothermales bacterium]
MRSLGLIALCFITLILSAPGCDATVDDGPAQQVIPRGNRVLSLDVTMAERNDFGADFARAQEAGAHATSLSLAWDDLEPAPETYTPDPNFLAIANAFYPAQNTQIDLMIGPIDTNNKRVPSDLADKPFDDPAVIERFERLLDYVFDQIPDLQLTSISIGNEIDAFLGTDAAAWARYQTFYEAAVARVRARRPGLLVGTKAMFGGLMGEARPFLEAINQASDVVMVTYYPLKSDFTVKDPSVVTTDFDALVAAYGAKPIYLLEAGYPSSATCRSSEQKQADFIREVFRAWDAHADRIPLISFTWLTDLPRAAVESFETYYGLSDPRFAAYLQTLGLRTYEGEGRDKEAYRALKTEAEARGW